MTDRDERERLATLRALEILDTPAEARFDRIARLAARALNAPTALISLVDEDRQWFKARVGFDQEETPIELSFCAHAIRGSGAFVVPDARRDPRFADNSLVTGAPGIRAYAGQPIEAPDGRPLGTLCVIHPEPWTLTGEDLETLADLAAWVELEIAAGEAARALRDMQDRFLSVASHELKNPLTAIKGYAEDLLDPATGELSTVQREDVETILHGAQQLEEVAGDATLTLRMAAGRLPGEPEEIVVSDLLSAAAREVAGHAAAAGVTLQLDPPGALIVEGYPDVLRIALARLLSDAIAASPRGATVFAHAREDGEDVVLRVADGRGAAAAADRSATLARSVAEHHGGRFEHQALVVPRRAQRDGARKR